MRCGISWPRSRGVTAPAADLASIPVRTHKHAADHVFLGRAEDQVLLPRDHPRAAAQQQPSPPSPSPRSVAAGQLHERDGDAAVVQRQPAGQRHVHPAGARRCHVRADEPDAVLRRRAAAGAEGATEDVEGAMARADAQRRCRIGSRKVWGRGFRSYCNKSRR